MKCTSSRQSRRLISALAFLATAAVTLAGTPFSRIVSFGDGLSDFSNMAQLTGGQFPSAPNGRQSNGPVWVEHLADRLQLSGFVSNYAVIGAMTGATTSIPTGNVWSDTYAGLAGTDLLSQVQHYLQDCHGTADPDALYILEGGTNDVPVIGDSSAVLSNLMGCFMLLHHAGAKHFVVVTMMDLGRSAPVIQAENEGLAPPGTAATLSLVCEALNGGLRTVLSWLASSSMDVTFADWSGFVGAVVANPEAYGMSEVYASYQDAGANRDPATFLFWDDYHPTTRAHQLFSEVILNSLATDYSARQEWGIADALQELLSSPGD